MQETGGDNYKEYFVKTMRNTAAKMVQEKYLQEFNAKFYPFTEKIFREAQEPQCISENRKTPSKAASKTDTIRMVKLWEQNYPAGLQKKLFHITSFELVWRAGEATSYMVYKRKKLLECSQIE